LIFASMVLENQYKPWHWTLWYSNHLWANIKQFI